MSERNGTLPLPPAFATVAGRLASVSPPADGVSPSGAWRAGYTVCVVHREPLAQWVCGPVGSLRLDRGPSRDGRFDLHVTLNLALPAGQEDRTVAALTCRADAAGSLVGWERSARFAATVQQGPAATPQRSDTGVVVGSRIVRRPGPSLTASAPVVANWAIFDTVLRAREPLRFSMLEELDAVRQGQRLRPLYTAEIAMAGGAVSLRGWLQTGEGILPTTWWLHETGMPLMVLAGLRAYVWNPAVTAEGTPR